LRKTTDSVRRMFRELDLLLMLWGVKRAASDGYEAVDSKVKVKLP
jgi:hypothetical protein